MNIIGKSALSDDIFKIREINLSDDVVESEWSRMIPSGLIEKVEEIRGYVHKEPERAIKEIQKIHLKHKTLPMLNNYLCTAYQIVGDEKQTRKVIKKSYELFPRYLFAKANYAYLCLEDEQKEKVPEIFEGKCDLQSLYPERDLFHLTEFIAFAGVFAIYFGKVGEKKLGDSYYQAMKKVDPRNPMTKNIKRILFPSLYNRFLKWLHEKRKE